MNTHDPVPGIFENLAKEQPYELWKILLDIPLIVLDWLVLPIHIIPHPKRISLFIPGADYRYAAIQHDTG
nr:hypothetical protein [Brucella sp. 10RB9215]